MKKLNKAIAIAAITATSMFSAQSVKAQSVFDFNDAASIEMMETSSFGEDEPNLGSYFASSDEKGGGWTDYIMNVISDPKYKEAIISLRNLNKITADDIRTTFKAIGVGYLLIEAIVTLWTHKPLLFHMIGW